MSLRNHTKLAKVQAIGKRLATAAWSRLPSQPVFRTGVAAGRFGILVVGIATVLVALATWFSGGQLYPTGSLMKGSLASKAVLVRASQEAPQEALANSPLRPLAATVGSRGPLRGEFSPAVQPSSTAGDPALPPTADATISYSEKVGSCGELHPAYSSRTC